MTIIQFVAMPSGEIKWSVRGNLFPAEIMFAIESLKLAILMPKENAGAVIPGMLRGDLSRVKPS